MARSFCLYDLETHIRVPLVEVDERMCAHFDQPCDPKHYLAGWYDSIGLSLALGMSFDEIVEQNTNGEYPWEAGAAIASWLSRHFRAECW